MMFRMIDVLCSMVTLLTTFAWAFRVFAKARDWVIPPIVSSVFFNLRPFYFPAIAVTTLYDLRRGDMTTVDYIFTAFGWLGGYWMRDDKDDDERWKRRREKLASKVQEAGGKLVVVPVGSNA